ncbi:hypothetical protein LTR37_006304 [Vermiconidia calcicola]|uniref:Uncharacterized protein n=1 Tax=Vermiconidia calcicola TaxID=1690605 RepID=A0ACC3NHV3_9PEZI|nr:hypothetical protein LTR37_006304 [Vermiconidia calcicola]
MGDTAGPAERPLRFFGFPRELRDNVYEDLKGELFVSGMEVSDDMSVFDEPEAEVTITSAVPHALLVSRQFRAEVEAQIGKSVTISNMSPFSMPPPFPRLTTPITNNLKQVNINLRASCRAPCNRAFTPSCYAVLHMHENIKWLKRTLDQLERTTPVHISFRFYLHSDVQFESKLTCGVGLDEAFVRVVAMERIVSLKVYKRGRWNSQEVDETYVS